MSVRPAYVGVRDYLTVFGLTLSFHFTAVLAAVWWAAYLNGGRFAISVDAVGEKHPELVLWFLLPPVLSVALYHAIREPTPAPE